MNKFGIAAILVAASVCLVSGAPKALKPAAGLALAAAAKHHHLEGEELEHLESKHGHFHGHHEEPEHLGHHHEHLRHHEEAEEFEHLKHGAIHGQQQLEYCLNLVEAHKAHKLGELEQHELHHGGHGGIKKGGLHHGIGARHGNAIEEREAIKGLAAAHEAEREHLHADQNRVGLKAAAKGVAAKQFLKNHSSDIGLRKHQQFNNDKTIIKDKSTGTNDFEVSRHVNDLKGGAAAAKGVIGAEGEFVRSRLDGERERDRDSIAKQALFRDREAALESGEF